MTSASNTMASNKGYNNKNNKKLQEVKEVIQNKSDNDIFKILEVFENDVSKTINAFMTDDGKEALSKWASMKKKSKQQDKSQLEASAVDESGTDSKASKPSPNNKKANKKQQQPSANNNNNKAGAGAINDLVSLIINQSITTTGTSTKPTTQPVVQPTSLNAQIEQQQDILNNLNNLIIGSQPSQSKIGGLKVTVLGIEQPTKEAAVKTTNNQSSLTSSPSSMSSNSTFDKDNKQGAFQNNTQSNTNRQKMSQNVNKPVINNLPPHPLNSHINRSYTNPNNTKNVLGSFQKDLQRQTQQLTRITSQFQEELSKSEMNINQTFMLLRNMLDQRQAQLQAELTTVSRNAIQTLNQRQQKASQLKVLGENVAHLNDQDTLELKADMKHFINERLLDEEFGKVKVFSEDNYDQLHEAIGNYGRVVQLNHIKYATSRPPVDKVLDGSYKVAAPIAQPQPQRVNSNTNGVNKNNNNKTSSAAATSAVSNGKHSVKIVDVDTLSDEDDEGEFIEVKKPQRNKNKQSTNGSLPTNGASVNNQNGKKSQVNGTANGHNQEANGINGNGVAPTTTTSNKKKKQKQNATTPASLKTIPKANQNPFSLIANGQY